MFCTKCGAKNEDNNVFCKECGAKLVKPVTNHTGDMVINNQGAPNHSAFVSQSTPNKPGAAQAAKSGKVKLIAGLAAALIAVIMVVGVLMTVGKGSSNKPLFEQIEIGKTSAADVEKYFDKNNLNWDWGVDSDIPIMTPDYNYLVDDEIHEEYVRNTMQNTLTDTLWGIECNYFVTASGDSEDKEKNRKVLYVAFMVNFEGNSGEKEFRQQMNSYIKKHQKTDLKYQIDSAKSNTSTYYYPLEIINLDGKKVLVCLSCYDTGEEIYLQLYAENYFSEKDLNKVMDDYIPEWEDAFWDPDGSYSFDDKIMGWYFGLTINEMYPEYLAKELDAIAKEVPAFRCSIDYRYDGQSFPLEKEKSHKGIIVEGLNESLKGDVVIPETICGYPVWEISPYAIKNFADATNSSNAIKNYTGITSLQIPDSVTNIGECAFSGCSGLTSINIPNGITEIKEETFSGCSSLTNITIPDSVTSIGSKAFANCSSLTSINIPSSVTDIADDAFDGCDNLVSNDLNARFPNAVPKPAWLEAYKEFYDSECCFFGADNNGVPYLVILAEYLYWYHYNGTEVEELPSNRCLGIEYNPKTNKALTDDYSPSPNGCFYFDNLYNLYTATQEMCFAYNEDYESGITTYYVNDSEVSKDEYDRMWSEMYSEFDKGGYGIGGYDMRGWYSSVDEAYQAYIANKPNISVSSDTSSVNNTPAAEATQAETASEYILKDSDSRYLSKADLQGLSADECRIARNEIYARHGRKFSDEGLQGYFNACSWYRGTIEPDDFQETMLSEIEVANKNLIVEYEKEMGYR